MLCEERLCKCRQILNGTVLRIRPPGRELKTVGRLRALPTLAPLFDMGVSCRVGVVLGLGPIGDDEQLHVLKQPTARPETVPLVTVDLVECFTDCDAAPLQFNVNHWQSVDEDGDVIAVGILSPGVVFIPRSRTPHFVLVDDLQPVVVDVLLVEQFDVLR